ncbi:hypothetical protein C8R44DRAFT_988604 [Mycena epipterygia]|nr:hypothetical protein C8R44DRAFT_988604 [Mycena epipterygia]
MRTHTLFPLALRRSRWSSDACAFWDYDASQGRGRRRRRVKISGKTPPCHSDASGRDTCSSCSSALNLFLTGITPCDDGTRTMTPTSRSQHHLRTPPLPRWPCRPHPAGPIRARRLLNSARYDEGDETHSLCPSRRRRRRPRASQGVIHPSLSTPTGTTTATNMRRVLGYLLASSFRIARPFPPSSPLVLTPGKVLTLTFSPTRDDGGVRNLDGRAPLRAAALHWTDERGQHSARRGGLAGQRISYRSGCAIF